MVEDSQGQVVDNNASKKIVRLIFLLIIPLVVIWLALSFYFSGGRFVSTQNAYVKVPIINIRAQIDGRISQTHVKDHVAVEKNQFLITQDSQLLEAQQRAKQAQLDKIRVNIRTQIAQLREAEVNILRAQEELKMARNILKGLGDEWQLKRDISANKVRQLEAEYNRLKQLVTKGAGAKSHLESVEFELKTARIEAQKTELRHDIDVMEHKVTLAQREIISREAQKATLEASLGGVRYETINQHPDIQKVFAEIDQLQQDITNSKIRAPDNGIVARMHLEPGEYLEQGDVVMAIVQTQDAWIEANLKETDLTQIRPGQPVEMIADTFPNQVFSGVVESISASTGSEFAVIPPQNASGNWVKVVQRLPVKISITDAKGKSLLRAGMSISVRIDTGKYRDAPSWISPFLLPKSIFG